MKASAAVARQAGAPLVIEAVDLDDLRDDEILVRIAAVGICHTDVAVQQGHIPVPLPAVLGHEGAGVVEAVGRSVTTLRPGDHVVLSQALCGHCQRCRSGEVAYCENAAQLSLGGRRADGSSTIRQADGPISGNFVGQSSFATHAVARSQNSFKVDSSLPLDVLAPLGCGVMTGAGAVFNDAQLSRGATIAVFGAGTVGLSAVMAAKACGASRIIAVDIRSERLDIATELGATDTFLASAENAEQIAEATSGGVDVAVEAAGAGAAAQAAVASTHSRGQTIIVGAAPYGTRLDLDWWSIAAGRTVRGSVIGSSDPARDIPRLIDLRSAGKLPLDRLIRKYSFESINEAIAGMSSGKVVKPVITFDNEIL